MHLKIQCSLYAEKVLKKSTLHNLYNAELPVVTIYSDQKQRQNQHHLQRGKRLKAN